MFVILRDSSACRSAGIALVLLLVVGLLVLLNGIHRMFWSEWYLDKTATTSVEEKEAQLKRCKRTSYIMLGLGALITVPALIGFILTTQRENAIVHQHG